MLGSMIDRLRYRLTPGAKYWGRAGYGDVDRMQLRLEAQGLDLSPHAIDPEDYRNWVERAQPHYERCNYYDGGQGPNFYEKALEHYMAAQLLRLGPGFDYLDIASDGSPTPEIYESLYGCNAWRQDLSYPPGVHGRKIGGDAAQLPLDEGSMDAMALHCSFEHFEGNRDSGFIREADRVLRPGGRLVILPLYLSDRHVIQTDPRNWPGLRPPFPPEPEAALCFTRGWKNRHGRFYSPEQFNRRVAANAGGMRLTLLRLTNAEQAHPNCYLRFIALFDKL